MNRRLKIHTGLNLEEIDAGLRADNEKNAAAAQVKPSAFVNELAQAMGATSGAALEQQVADANAPLSHSAVFALIDTEQLNESPTNPRKTFGDLAQLAESIKRGGLLQPLVVRLRPNVVVHVAGVTEYEIVAGHRRYRAAKLAGLNPIPCMVRELTDAQVVELQLVENLRREGLNPIEEAEGYAALQARGLSVESIASKLATSKATIYARLKLLGLCSEARNALLDGLLHPSVATPLARLSHRLQAKALDAPALRAIDGQPAPARAAIDWLQREYVRSLRGCPFDLKDETLVPDAGSCAKCPKRTKNSPDLFDDLQKVGDACTDVTCYTEKARANWQRVADAKKAAGATVLSVKDSAELFPYGSSLYDTKLVELDAPNPADPKRRTWRELLEAKAGEDAPTLTVAVDRDWKVRELVPRRAAVKVLAKAGLKWAEAEVESHARKPAAAEAKAEQEDRDLEVAVAGDMLGQVAAGFVKAIDVSPGVRVVLELLAASALEQVDYAALEELRHAEHYGKLVIDGPGSAVVAKLTPSAIVDGLVLSLLERVADDEEPRKRLAKAWSIDTKALVAARRAASDRDAEKAKAEALFNGKARGSP